MTASAAALALPYPASRRWSCVGSGPERAEQGPGLAGKQALEAADDLGLALALEGSSGDVGAGGFVVLHAHDDRPVEGGVGLAVTAAVEPVSGGQTGGGRYRGDAAEPGPGRLGAAPVDVVTGDDEQLGGGVRADAEGRDQLEHEPAGELGEQRLVGLDLLVELLPAAGDRAQRVLGGRGHGGDRSGT